MADFTDKEETFITSYLATLNIRAAGTVAGYCDASKAYEVFRKPHIRAEIKRRITERLGEMDVTADRVLRELANIAFANRGEAVQIQTGDFGGQLVRIIDSDLWPAELHAAMKSVSQDKDGCIKIEWHDKQSALVALAKHLGIGVDDENTGVKVFVVPVQSGSEEEWEAQAKKVAETSRQRASETLDKKS